MEIISILGMDERKTDDFLSTVVLIARDKAIANMVEI